MFITEYKTWHCIRIVLCQVLFSAILRKVKFNITSYSYFGKNMEKDINDFIW